jgi:hypothetical protein
MKHPEENVALQAVEFWSTVCEEEIDLAIEAAEVGSLLNVFTPGLFNSLSSGPRIRRSARA